PPATSAAAPAPPAAQSGKCAVCRHQLKPGAQFCASCGARVANTAAPGSAQQRSFGFQMSAPIPQNGMRDAGLGDWHEGPTPSPGFAAQSQHGPALSSNPIRNQWGRHLEEIVNPVPTDPTVFLRRGISLARENQLIEATEQFEQASKLAPRDPMPRYHLGLVRYRMADLEGAIGEFERALRINPNFPDAHNDLGLVLTKKGQVREAIHHFRKALQIQPQHPDAHYNLGYACLAMGDPVGASTHLDMYLRIAPNAPDARAVGEMLMRLRQQQPPPG
ncbi:MAG TPA: tetratricopeptide repeat protein, partial [Candidatus Xenobia bacterium]